MKALLVIVTGLIIAIVFRTINKIFVYINKKFLSWSSWFNPLPVIEFFVWFAYVFWAIGFLFKDKFFYDYLVIGLVLITLILFSWYILKDIISGIIFNVQNDLKKNKKVQVGNSEGIIKSKNLLNVSIETQDGKRLKIPFSKLKNDTIIELPETESSSEFKFRIPVSKTKDKQETEEYLKLLVINSPWCNFTADPLIKLKSEDDDHYVFDIFVKTLNHQHLRLLEKYIALKIADSL